MSTAMVACCLLVWGGNPETGWARSENFIVMAPNQEVADAVLQAGESYRQKLAQ